MRLKQRPGDFHVRELLNEDYIAEAGPFAVYRVTKKKMTTPEVVKILAKETGLETGDVKTAGLKDRQAVTTQYMSVPRKHRTVAINDGDLKIDAVGYAANELTAIAVVATDSRSPFAPSGATRFGSCAETWPMCASTA